jgi:hypothetical protein
VVELPGDARLLPKIHVNLGITQEADGRLLAACHNYRRARCTPCMTHTPPAAPACHGNVPGAGPSKTMPP